MQPIWQQKNYSIVKMLKARTLTEHLDFKLFHYLVQLA
jgi:hypothetical protein